MDETAERLAAIQKRADSTPHLRVYSADGIRAASVFEESDGLDTVCVIPDYYPPEVQNALAESIAAMSEDREFLLALIHKQTSDQS